MPDGLTLVDRSDDRCTYRHDGTKIPSPRLFTLLAGIPGIRDIQMEPESIETVIANLYRKVDKNFTNLLPPLSSPPYSSVSEAIKLLTKERF